MQSIIFHKNDVENIYVPNESKTHGTFILYWVKFMHIYVWLYFNECISKYCNIYHDCYIYTLDYHDKLFWIE